MSKESYESVMKKLLGETYNQETVDDIYNTAVGQEIGAYTGYFAEKRQQLDNFISGLGDGAENVFKWLETNILPYITGEQNYNWNKLLQDDAQSFSAYEASKQRDWQSNESQLTRDFNSAEAQKQRDHDLYMASNAYQLKAEDMRAAGLNPYLAYGTGGAEFHSGASASANAPSGAAASSSANHTNAGAGMLGNIIGTVLHSVTSSLFNNALNVSRDEQRQQYAMEQLEYKYNRMEDRDEKQMLLNVIEFMSKFGKGKKRA